LAGPVRIDVGIPLIGHLIAIDAGDETSGPILAHSEQSSNLGPFQPSGQLRTAGKPSAGQWAANARVWVARDAVG